MKDLLDRSWMETLNRHSELAEFSSVGTQDSGDIVYKIGSLEVIRVRPKGQFVELSATNHLANSSSTPATISVAREQVVQQFEQIANLLLSNLAQGILQLRMLRIL
jgi:hypothetical protein